MWESYKKKVPLKWKRVESRKQRSWAQIGRVKKGENGESRNPSERPKQALVNATSWVEGKRNRNVTAHNTDNTAFFVLRIIKEYLHISSVLFI